MLRLLISKVLLFVLSWKFFIMRCVLSSVLSGVFGCLKVLLRRVEF